MSAVAEAVDGGDLDALIRMVDGLCSTRDWDAVIDLRDRCRHALEARGLQLWPAAEYAEYRLALDAPGSYAGPVVLDQAGRFALGPLWEVAASAHTWADLREHLPPGPARTLVAHDRVLRGEDLTADESIDRMILEVPLLLEDWEPPYPVATYRSSEAEFPSPPPTPLGRRTLPPAGEVTAADDSVEALVALALPWMEQSNGSAAAVSVTGSGLSAITALIGDEAMVAAVPGVDAMALLAWAGASGGAYGRRRGAALGRFAAWWAVATIAGLDWPVARGEMASVLAELQWWVWEPLGDRHGWSASIAVEDPDHGLAWALLAQDDRREDDPLQV